MDRVLSWIGKVRQATKNIGQWRIYEEKYFHMAAIFQHDEVIEQLPENFESLQLVAKNWDLIIQKVTMTDSVFDILHTQAFYELLKEGLDRTIQIEKKLSSPTLHQNAKAFHAFIFE